MPKYKPDDTFKESPNGLFKKEWAKSYTFYLRPRFDSEKETYIVLWVIEDLQKAVSEKGLPENSAKSIYLTGIIDDPNNKGNKMSAPLSGNASISVGLFNLPDENPLTKEKHHGRSQDGQINFDKRTGEFDAQSFLQLIEYRKKYPSPYDIPKTITTIDDYFDDALETTKTIYKMEIYKVKVTSESDIPKLQNPDYNVELTQTPNSDTNTNSENQSATQSQPTKPGTYTFNVERKGYFVIPGVGEFKIVSEVDSKSTSSDDLPVDDEYRESAFEGEEELAQTAEAKLELQSERISDDIPNQTQNLSSNLESINYNSAQVVGGDWKKYNIDDVLVKINKTQHKPNAKFKESLKRILFWIKSDSLITDPREAAYLLGTAYAESGYSLQRWEADYACTGIGIPYGSGGPCSKATNYYKNTNGKKDYYTLGTDSKGFPYFGRGLIQLTGKANYEKYGKKIGVDLVSNGDLALKEENSYKVASIYLKSLVYKHVLSGDLTTARKRVNGGTKGIDEVNGAYRDWLSIFNNPVV